MKAMTNIGGEQTRGFLHVVAVSSSIEDMTQGGSIGSSGSSVGGGSSSGGFREPGGSAPDAVHSAPDAAATAAAAAADTVGTAVQPYDEALRRWAVTLPGLVLAGFLAAENLLCRCHVSVTLVPQP